MMALLQLALLTNTMYVTTETHTTTAAAATTTVSTATTTTAGKMLLLLLLRRRRLYYYTSLTVDIFIYTSYGGTARYERPPGLRMESIVTTDVFRWTEVLIYNMKTKQSNKTKQQ